MSVIQINHVCLECYNPIKLEQEFQKLTKSEVSSLFDNLQNRTESSQPATILPFKNTVSPHPVYSVLPDCSQNCLNDEEALIMLQSYTDDTLSLDHRIKVCYYLFDLLGGRTNVDHPLCRECAANLLNDKQQELKYREDELSSLQDFLNFIDSGKIAVYKPIASTDDLEHSSSNLLIEKSESCSRQSALFNTAFYQPGSLLTDTGWYLSLPLPNTINVIGDGCQLLSSLELKVAMLHANMAKISSEVETLDDQLVDKIADLKDKIAKLDNWTLQYNERKISLLQSEDELASLETRLGHVIWHLQRLRRANILNTAFVIWYDGHIGLINGLHLGRLSTRPVDWEEINAAWGQCAMLLYCIARKVDFVFIKDSVTPLGNQSVMVQLSTQKEYPLYYITTGVRILGPDKFSLAMMMFLDCVEQLRKFTEIRIPYAILDRGLIQDSNGHTYSIKSCIIGVDHLFMEIVQSLGLIYYNSLNTIELMEYRVGGKLDKSTKINANQLEVDNCWFVN